jgi:hypothetical protein
MTELLKWLDGKKTYICAIMIAVTFILHSQNIVDNSIRDLLFAVFGGGAIASLRKGMEK